MKALKLIAFGIITFAVQGCYTVIWTPDVAFPTKERSENSDSFYDEPYYGDYYPYYELPWWYSITPPSSLIIPARDTETKVRNSSSSDRGTPERTPISNPAPSPSRDQTPTTTQTTTSDDNSSKKSESTSPQREKGDSSNSRDTRNNDGSRSSDTPRR